MKRVGHQTAMTTDEISYDMQRAKQAVRFLVDSSYFHHHVTKLRNTVGRPRSLPFKDEAESLNELLAIGRQNLQAMENLIAVAEMKRNNKNDYQREYMAAKRRRERKVLQLEELMGGKPLTSVARAKALQYQTAVWAKERDEFLKKQPDMSWLAKNEAVRQFWDTKEHELDQLIEVARERGPVKRRRVVKVEQEAKTSFGKALQSAIKKTR